VIDAFMGHLPLTPAEEGPAIAAALRVPEDCAFERVYLRMSLNGTGDIELFPVR
jgi:hypothetical protein